MEEARSRLGGDKAASGLRNFPEGSGAVEPAEHAGFFLLSPLPWLKAWAPPPYLRSTETKSKKPEDLVREKHREKQAQIAHSSTKAEAGLRHLTWGRSRRAPVPGPGLRRAPPWLLLPVCHFL